MEEQHRRREDVIADGCDSSKLAHDDAVQTRTKVDAVEARLDKKIDKHYSRTTKLVWFSILVGIVAEGLSMYLQKGN